MSTPSLPRLTSEELQSLYPISAWRPAAHFAGVVLAIALAMALAHGRQFPLQGKLMIRMLAIDAVGRGVKIEQTIVVEVKPIR